MKERVEVGNLREWFTKLEDRNEQSKGKDEGRMLQVKGTAARVALQRSPP